MKIILTALLLVAISFSSIGQIRIGKLSNPDFDSQEGTYVVGYAKSYLSQNDVNEDKNAVCLAYSRHYSSTESDTMFARMNLNDIDMDFKEYRNKTYDYISLNGKYKLKVPPSSGKETISIYYGKAKKTINVFVKSNSG